MNKLGALQEKKLGTEALIISPLFVTATLN